MTSQELFIVRIRRQRERNGVTLEAVAGTTRVRLDQLEALERGDLSAWPRGLYARAWIRGYAEASGLEVDETVEEFCRLFPQGDRRMLPMLNDLAAILDVPARFTRDEAAGAQEHDRRASDRAMPLPAASWRDRVSTAVRIVADARVRELPVRLVESWRTLRPSRRAS